MLVGGLGVSYCRDQENHLWQTCGKDYLESMYFMLETGHFQSCLNRKPWARVANKSSIRLLRGNSVAALFTLGLGSVTSSGHFFLNQLPESRLINASRRCGWNIQGKNYTIVWSILETLTPDSLLKSVARILSIYRPFTFNILNPETRETSSNRYALKWELHLIL